jgi:hypothetical protein
VTRFEQASDDGPGLQRWGATALRGLVAHAVPRQGLRDHKHDAGKNA